MRFKIEQELTRAGPKPFMEPPVLGRLFQKKGVYDGRLFHSSTKVTYTFVNEKEVISLHFDKSRGAIFYKGHNIENSALAQGQVGHLQQFLDALKKEKATQPFVRPYKKTLKKYLAHFITS